MRLRAVIPGRSRQRRVRGSLAVLAWCAMAGGCAPTAGWVRDDRVCDGGDAARVCFEAEPDAPLSLVVGDAELVPGECAFAPQGAGGGSLRVVLTDGKTGDATAKRVGTRPGKTTVVRADLSAERSPCSRSR